MKKGTIAQKINIVDYDPAWVTLYEQAKAELLSVVGQYVERIEHIGSTSVPGLAAKPVIDIMIGMRDLADAAHCIAPIEALGFEYKPKYEDEMPFRRLFSKPSNGGLYHSSHHIHMVETRHEFWARHLLFRDYLRAHPDDAAAYAAHKRELAPHFSSGNEYATAKTAFISAIIDKARVWQESKNH